MDPSAGLLHSDAPPLCLAEKLAFITDFLVDFFREHDVTILVVVVEVFF